MNNKNKLQGFTLIELLFVIAIISVLVSLGLSMTQQRGQQAKIEKAALQMQQLMQAGMAYYVDNNCWPDSVNTDPSTNPKCREHAPLFSQYLPVNENSVNTNYPGPWGQNYSWGSPKLSDGTTVLSSLFEVWMNTPDPAAASTGAPIAQRIAGMLPNAGTGTQSSTLTNGCTANNCVYSQVTIPAQAAASSSPPVYITAIGYVTKDQLNTNLFSCNAGYIPKVFPNLVAYQYKHIGNDNKERTGSGSFYSPTFMTRLLPTVVINNNPSVANSYYATLGLSKAGSGETTAVMCDVWVKTAFTNPPIECTHDGTDDSKINNYLKQSNDDIFADFALSYVAYCCKTNRDGTVPSSCSQT